MRKVCRNTLGRIVTKREERLGFVLQYTAVYCNRQCWLGGRLVTIQALYRDCSHLKDKGQAAGVSCYTASSQRPRHGAHTPTIRLFACGNTLRCAQQGAQGSWQGARCTARRGERHCVCNTAPRHGSLRLLYGRQPGHDTALGWPRHGMCARAWACLCAQAGRAGWVSWAKLVHCTPGSVLTQF